MARAAMVRTHEWKLIYRIAGESELYNLARDPDELTNSQPGLGDIECYVS